MIRYSHQTIANPEFFAVCARRMSTQELLEQIEWLPDWVEETVRLARQILFDRIAKHYKPPLELLELPMENSNGKLKATPGTLLNGF